MMLFLGVLLGSVVTAIGLVAYFIYKFKDVFK